MRVPRPRLAVTLGDCAGIGPELVLRALACPDLAAACQLIVYGSLTLLRRVAEAAGLKMMGRTCAVVPHDCAAQAPLPLDRHLFFDFPFAEAATLLPGRVQSACGAQAYDWVCAAVRDIQNGLADGLVTAPINKEALHLAGVKFPGHTEMLAHLTQTSDPRMAFYSPGLVVSLATIHEPLAKVPGLLSADSLLRTIRLTHAACQGFGVAAPRLGVLALNPHAGENGLFGREEQTAIAPAIEKARGEGLNASGPLVPDAAFTWLCARPPAAAPFDAYIAMYHDQGLIPFKMVAFDTGVNVTLGLPLIRTSPDHGTAFALAWQGKASPASLFSAIALAARMVQKRKP
jgi:4-hydroxythreonine-4-phosphate dehydrogenase